MSRPRDKVTFLVKFPGYVIYDGDTDPVRYFCDFLRCREGDVDVDVRAPETCRCEDPQTIWIYGEELEMMVELISHRGLSACIRTPAGVYHVKG